MLSARQLVFILLSLNLVFAADYMPLVPAIAIITVILLAVIFMIARAISNPQLEAWVRSEIRELIAGALLIAIISGLIFTAHPLSSLITGEPNYMTASENIIDGILNDPSTGYHRAYEDIIRSAGRIKVAASYAPWLSIPLYYVSLIYSEAPLSGVAPVFSALGGAVQGLTNVVFLYEGLLLILKFSHVVVPAMLLPISFSLRLFPLTRRIGNTLIAVSLAAYVLLPFSIILVGEMNEIIDYPQAAISGGDLEHLDADVALPVMLASPFCHNEFIRTLLSLNELLFSVVVCFPLLLTPWTAGAYYTCQPMVQYFIYPLITVTFQLMYIAFLLPWLATIGAVPELYLRGSGAPGFEKGILDVLFPFLKSVTDVVLVGYLNFILMGLVTISGARSISVALGGEWYLGGIQRLI